MTNPGRFIPPWASDFTNEANNAWAVVAGDVSAVTGGAVNLPPSIIPPSIVPPATPITPPPPVTPPPSAPGSTVPSGGVPGVIPAANVTGLAAALEKAFERDIASYAEQYMAAVLTGQKPALVPNVTIDGQNLTHEAAKSHGLRTLLIGLATAAVSAVLSALGQTAHIDFFSRAGWVATGTLAVGAAVSGIVAYLSRLQVTPAYEQKLLAAPPPPSISP